MVQNTTTYRYRGISLVETMVAAVVLLIAVIGTAGFRYNAALDGRKAKAQAGAARIALVLAESWRGIYGVGTYDPTLLESTDFDISELNEDDAPDEPADFTTLDSYKVILDENAGGSVEYYVTLSWKDVQTGLRALNITIAWDERGTSDDDNWDKSYSLTVYTQTF